MTFPLTIWLHTFLIQPGKNCLWLKKDGAIFTAYPKTLLWGKQLSICFRKLLLFEKLHDALCVTVLIFLHVVFLTSTLSFYVKYFPLGSFQVSVVSCETHLNISTILTQVDITNSSNWVATLSFSVSEDIWWDADCIIRRIYCIYLWVLRYF